jgi:DnaK suppressor protein
MVERRAAGETLSERELQELRRALIRERKRLVAEEEEISSASLRASQSDLSGEVSFDEEYADAGSFTFEREKDFSIAQNIKDLVEKIDRALAKMEGGTYGICESCGKPIEKARLKALPYASLCLACKKKEARGL